MNLKKIIYEKITGRKAPYYFDYSIGTIIMKPIRKYLVNVIAAHSPFNCVRIFIYKMCGFKIGRNVFIGMRCYLDDMCYDLMTIGNNVTISYGVFFACHGKNQGHVPIVIEDNVYIGMRATIITKNSTGTGVRLGQGAIIGACALVNKDIPPGVTAVGVPCKIIAPTEKIQNSNEQAEIY